MSRARGDAELLARTRVIIGSLLVYGLCMAFFVMADHLYAGTNYAVYSRLAVLPFFLLIVRIWIRLVRVRPPSLLAEARRLVALGRHQASRERLARVDGDDRQARRLNRARRMLQGKLAVPLADEVLLETGRCSLLLGELDRAVDELGKATARLPLRADVAMELAEALDRRGDRRQATEVLRQAAPQMDAVDVETVQQTPSLFRLLDGATLPERSSFYPTIRRERILAALLGLAAVAHAVFFYLDLVPTP